jgi:hypothetical protein
MNAAELSSMMDIAGISAKKWFRTSSIRSIIMTTSSNREFVSPDSAQLYFDPANMLIEIRYIEKQADGAYAYPTGYSGTDDGEADCYIDINSVAGFTLWR